MNQLTTLESFESYTARLEDVHHWRRLGGERRGWGRREDSWSLGI